MSSKATINIKKQRAITNKSRMEYNTEYNNFKNSIQKKTKKREKGYKEKQENNNNNKNSEWQTCVKFENQPI